MWFVRLFTSFGAFVHAARDRTMRTRVWKAQAGWSRSDRIHRIIWWQRKLYRHPIRHFCLRKTEDTFNAEARRFRRDSQSQFRRVPVTRSMGDPKPYPLNVDGPFYVENGCCITCDLPRATAPDMFRYNDAGDHCYIYKQPETEEELRRMVEVAACSEVGCIRYRGRDKRVLRLLKESGCANNCDH